MAIAHPAMQWWIPLGNVIACGPKCSRGIPLYDHKRVVSVLCRRLHLPGSLARAGRLASLGCESSIALIASVSGMLFFIAHYFKESIQVFAVAFSLSQVR
eukprot:scaffold2351_cov403-Prasinococcus_capsulatus_cf.AAC.11